MCLVGENLSGGVTVDTVLIDRGGRRRVEEGSKLFFLCEVEEGFKDCIFVRVFEVVVDDIHCM